jgi:hypothetical protein
MEAIGGTVSSVGKSVMIGNFIMNMFLGGILQELLAAMNKLQIMIHLLLINVTVPGHALIYFEALLGLITFQIYDFSPLLTRMFALSDQDTVAFNDNLYYLGYQSTYFILNMGNIFLLLLLEFMIIAFIAATQKAKDRNVQNIHS